VTAVAALRDTLVQGKRVRLAPPPALTVSEWADRYRYLSAYAAEQGKWETARTPYLREIMDVFNDPTVNEVVFMKCARIGGTEAGLNVVGYYIHQDPSPILIVQPTVDDAKHFSKEQLAPMIADTPVLRERVSDPKSRDSGNTIDAKAFVGGGLYLVGANSPRGFRRRTARVVNFEEIDGYPVSAGSEGSPLKLGRNRAATYGWRKKLYYNSTPTLKGMSPIEDLFARSDQRYYLVPCPECGHRQRLVWGRLKYEGLPEPMFACEECGSLIAEERKYQMLEAGAWVATADSRMPGFQINALYSTLGVTWSDLVSEWTAAQTDVTALQVFINTALGETWEERGGGLDPAALEARREAYPADVPEWVAVLTAGVDVQDNRLAYVIRGWGAGEESALIEQGELDGDPTRDAVWKALDARLLHPRTTPSGRAVPVFATGVDTGHHTESAYAYCKPRWGRRVFALKGSGTPGAPLAPRKASINNKARVRLFLVGTIAAKDLIYGRLKIAVPGPGYYHFHAEASGNYFGELTAEKLMKVQVNGRWVRKYVLPRGARNEALDCEVYALAALYISGVNRHDLGKMAGKPPQNPEQPPEPAPEPDAPPMKATRLPTVGRRTRKGWVKGW